MDTYITIQGHTFRAKVWLEDGFFVARSLDLDALVQAQTMERLIERLVATIRMSLTTKNPPPPK